VDIVCNNAGIGNEGNVFNFADTLQWKKMMDINLTAVIHGTQLAILAMKKSGKGGVIINTASLAGLVPQKFGPLYAVSKSAVVYLARCLEHLDASDNIRVVAICPGFTKSALSDKIKDVITNTFKDTIMPVEEVVEGFVELVTDKHKKGGGAVMRITPRTGRDYPSIQNRKARL